MIRSCAQYGELDSAREVFISAKSPDSRNDYKAARKIEAACKGISLGS
jgi:hypothetical protein